MADISFWKGKKVFLTGHTGFKGSWLSIWLHELGSQVLGYALEPSTSPSLYNVANVDKLIHSVIGDIRNLDFLKQTMLDFEPDIVIHMAAQPLVRESYVNPVDTYTINVIGTVNVLESVRYCKSVKAVLNVTTDKVYENKEWLWGYRESDRLGGYDPYSNSKACSELITSSYVNSFFNPGSYSEHSVAVATARAGNVIGGGDWANERLIPDIIRAIEKKEEIIIRNPKAIRPWQHVLDPLSGYLILLENLHQEGTRWGGSWNFGPDEESFCCVGEIVEKVCGKFKYPLKFTVKDTELHETQLLKLDNSKSKTLLNWRPEINIIETVEMINSWYDAFSQDKDMKLVCLEQIKGMNL